MGLIGNIVHGAVNRRSGCINGTGRPGRGMMGRAPHLLLRFAAEVVHGCVRPLVLRMPVRWLLREFLGREDRKEEKHEKNDNCGTEQKFRDTRSAGGNSREPENCCDDRDDREDDCPLDHESLLPKA
jgi:hypothetical protein